MKIKCLILFILIVLCVVTALGCLGFEEKTGEIIKSNVSEKENSSAESEEFSDYEKYPSSEDPVFEEVKFDKNSLHFSEILNDFDTVTANPDAFRKAAAEGTVKLYLRGQCLKLNLTKLKPPSQKP